MRPPWAKAEPAFSTLCERCDACREACPEGVVRQGADGLPEINFSDGHCSFCRACVEVCPTDALAVGGSEPWPYLANIDASCLAARGIVCRTCGEHCEAGAISFKLALGGRAVAEIDETACTGCGACVGICPGNSISIERKS